MMRNNKITLKEAEEFHGHLGPWLILGVRAGEFALKKLKCKKFFGIEVKVRGANEKPRSCLIDGLQLSTGATYGKGNIQKIGGAQIRAEFCNPANQKRITLSLKKGIVQRLRETRSHKDAEILAKKLYNATYNKLFKMTPPANAGLACRSNAGLDGV